MSETTTVTLKATPAVLASDQNLPAVADDYQKLEPEDRQRVDELVGNIDLMDSQAVIQYGIGAQKQISTFADSILEQIRAKDAGFAGEILTGLMLRVQEVDVGSLAGGGSFWSKVPIIGGLFNKMKKFMARYEKLDKQIDNIVDELDTARMQLLRDITMLDNLFEKNYQYFKELNYHILAGEVKLQQIREEVLPEMERKVQESQDAFDAQKLNDFKQMINRFEKKLHDLKLSKMIVIQSAPQIRMVQNNNQTLVEKIQSSILNTIPLWKNQIVIAISIARQKKAVEIQRQVTDTTNDLLKRNAEMLRQTSSEVARESERGIVDIETLKKVNDDLINTIQETLKIQEEGRQKRMEAEKELVSLEKELKDKVVSLST